MSINQRKHIRFSLDIPAILVTKHGERHETLLQQISIGGCFTEWEENIYAGDEFRLEIELPNKNRLPLACKAIYRFEDTGIGVSFPGVTLFEQELISKIIANKLQMEGLPTVIDPFKEPSPVIGEDDYLRFHDRRRERERMLESAMSSDEPA